MLFRPVRKLMQLGAIVAQIQDGIAQGCRRDMPPLRNDDAQVIRELVQGIARA